MEEYIADLQEQLITAQHRFMKMHRIFALQVFAKVSLSCWRSLKERTETVSRGVLASDIAKRLGIWLRQSQKC